VKGRLYDRVRVRWPSRLITSHETIEGMTRNLSLSGIFLYYSHTDPRALPLPTDDLVHVVFKIPGHERIRARARVAWSEILAVEETSTLLGVGLELVDIRYEDRKYLLEVITDMMPQAKDDAS
jgi:hypothetical protein